MKDAVKIKRFIRAGNLRTDLVEDTVDLQMVASAAMKEHNIFPSIGEVVFEGEDGHFYAVTLKAVIDRVHPDYVKNLDKK